jgi:hypothetical protein
MGQFPTYYPEKTIAFPVKPLHKNRKIEDTTSSIITLCKTCLFEKESLLINNPTLTFGYGKCSSSTHKFIMKSKCDIINNTKKCPVFQFTTSTYEKPRCYHCVMYNLSQQK